MPDHAEKAGKFRLKKPAVESELAPLEDLSGALDVILFPDAYRRAKAVLGGPAQLLVTGVIERDAAREEPFLRAERVTVL